ncbi:MAG TPA: hypothetical protein DF383_02740 [Deltaproteobacteria bacterium]|nr:hypothetical protein [Deltaproteobacteria bacterium]
MKFLAGDFYKKSLASPPIFFQSETMTPPSVHETAGQIAMLSHELPWVGRLLYGVLEKAILALRSGRAPRTLGLAAMIVEGEGLRQSLAEIIAETQDAGGRFDDQTREMADEALAEQQQLLERELTFWKNFSDQAQNFLRRLALLADQEKPSSLALNSLNDAWEEIERLSLGSAPIR